MATLIVAATGVVLRSGRPETDPGAVIPVPGLVRVSDGHQPQRAPGRATADGTVAEAAAAPTAAAAAPATTWSAPPPPARPPPARPTDPAGPLAVTAQETGWAAVETVAAIIAGTGTAESASSAATSGGRDDLAGGRPGVTTVPGETASPPPPAPAPPAAEAGAPGHD